MRLEAERIMKAAIASVMPGAAVSRALGLLPFGDSVTMIAIGKAAFPMGEAAVSALGGRLRRGIILTKCGLAHGQINGVEVYEAGHPVPDENSVAAAEKIIGAVSGLGSKDDVLLLLSGGGSALFEKPKDGLTLEDIAEINASLLRSGADIYEINAVRKRLSAVKGGRFAKLCGAARITTLALSDVLHDRPDVIASGIAVNDESTSAEAIAVIDKYKLDVDIRVQIALRHETPRLVKNPRTIIIGSVEKACYAAAAEAEALGYQPVIVNKALCGGARQAGEMLGRLAREYMNAEPETAKAFILGGETTVDVKGNGLGGRNQELALASAAEIAGLDGVCVFSFDTDGEDGPTDAAGGYVDGGTFAVLGAEYSKVLAENDSYNALKKTGGLLFTGQTGTNVNSLSIALCGKKRGYALAEPTLRKQLQ